ncbi:MAG: bifunctional diaminohydroxyphosphoribosylaminopyrimidine deaminase/5-amino-6-(5-phosphoribosylamino)uracil reductase RibD [bacterium]|nr:bifunctional diaminohydroxyphosphoribosylaminopyrimidine deaminase/5-amino-6-(5-phosphoribosylamino)uracil reductase RibD [bacterium]
MQSTPQRYLTFGVFRESDVDQDEYFMRIALREAARGIGATSPNPRVGAVLVAGSKALARGYHHSYGTPHAEVDCLAQVPAEKSRGATLYANLEPCCHHGKTPPCSNAVISAGIKRVVYGMLDPNTQVNGRGLRELHQAGIEVVGPVLEQESRELNRGYIKQQSTGRPWVALKFAQSLDGRIAACGGDARWISSPEGLKLAHRQRAEHDAILVGINTVLADDPQLTVRLVKGRNPQRLVLDGDLRIKPSAKIFKANPLPVLIATRPYPPDEKVKQLPPQLAELIWIPPDRDGHIDLGLFLDELGRRGILYVLVEGGADVFSSFMRTRLFDELIAVIAPKIIGGDGIPSVGKLGIKRVGQAMQMRVHKRKTFGPDTAIWFRPESTS